MPLESPSFNRTGHLNAVAKGSPLPDEKHKQPITLQVIADEAGVTRALVSMALRNSSKVAAATRERIQGIARKLGYHPNPMVRTLMAEVRQRRKITYQATLGFITNLETADCWRTGSVVYAEYFKGAQARGRSLGYQVEHFWLGEHRAKPSRLVEILQARGIPGVLIPPLPQDDHTFALDLSGFSAVTFGYSLQSPSIHRFCNNHAQTVQDAVEQLVRRGYRHIGFAISALEIQQVNYLWWGGLAISQYRFPDLKFSIYKENAFTPAAFHEWFQRERPEVVIGLHKNTYLWLLELGLSIPEDIGFLHLDCRRDGTLSGMYQHTEKLGGAALEFLASLVEGSISSTEGKPKIMMINSDFHEGETLRAPLQ